MKELTHFLKSYPFFAGLDNLGHYNSKFFPFNCNDNHHLLSSYYVLSSVSNVSHALLIQYLS